MVSISIKFQAEKERNSVRSRAIRKSHALFTSVVKGFCLSASEKEQRRGETVWAQQSSIYSKAILNSKKEQPVSRPSFTPTPTPYIHFPPNSDIVERDETETGKRQWCHLCRFRCAPEPFYFIEWRRERRQSRIVDRNWKQFVSLWHFPFPCNLGRTFYSITNACTLTQVNFYCTAPFRK
jgi:hypothetical protein